MTPTDRYIILNPQGQPVFSSNDVHVTVLWFWGRDLADSLDALAKTPWTVLDYEYPVLVRCPCTNCLGNRLGDAAFPRICRCAVCDTAMEMEER